MDAVHQPGNGARTLNVRMILAAIAFLGTGAGGLVAQEPATSALAEYVAKHDDAYGWVKRREGIVGQTSYVELILTSQSWRNTNWRHQLFVIKPAGVAEDTKHALLFITGGRWKDELEDPAGEDDRLPRQANMFATLAAQVKTPIAVLLHVPHQPLFGGKNEDEIIAYTFEKFIQSGDSTWPLLLPMVKSAVRGMDAVQELARQDWSLDIETFTVTGASKRGWTTWLTGAVDPRAAAIAPMVIDVLNMAPQMKHQLAAWGSYSPQIHDYTELGLQESLQSNPGARLQTIVDPFRYRQQLTQPKLIMIGTNDPYWPLDALNLYWDDLVGDKHILYVPNNGHGLKDLVRVVGSLNALHQHTLRGAQLPTLDWTFAAGDDILTLRIASDPPPVEVRVWQATSPTRDFRTASWSSAPTDQRDDGYVYDQQLPETGYAAIFGEAVYSGQPLPFFLSTNVRVVGADEVPAAGPAGPLRHAGTSPCLFRLP